MMNKKDMVMMMPTKSGLVLGAKEYLTSVFLRIMILIDRKPRHWGTFFYHILFFCILFRRGSLLALIRQLHGP